MSGSQTFKNNRRRAQGGNWRPSRKCVGKCRWCDCKSHGRPEEPWHGLPRSAVRCKGLLVLPLSQEKILPTETNATTAAAPSRGMRKVERKEGRRCRDFNVVSVDERRTNVLFNVSGFRRTNATGIPGERNIYFRLVF